MRIRVQRSNPSRGEGSHFQEFNVPYVKGMTVLDALLHVKDYLDHSVAIRYSCRMACCGSCGMKVNGKPSLACETQIAELKGDSITVQPMDNFPIVRDLVVDLDGFFEKHRSIVPHLVRADVQEQNSPSREYEMKSEELEEILQFTYCIKCGLCTSSCPTNATDSIYPGPQALAQAYRYLMDTRDEGGAERMEIVDSQHGVWRCHFAGSCSSVCPKGVDPALGIQLLKRHVMAAKPPRRKGEGAKVVVPSEKKV